MKREADDAKAAMDALTRDKVSNWCMTSIITSDIAVDYFFHSFIQSDILFNVFLFQANAEKTVKQQQHVINEYQNKMDEANRTLNDMDAAKKKLAAENTDLLRQVEEAESQMSQLSKIKLSLTNQLEDQRKLADDESRVSKELKWKGQLYKLNIMIIVIFQFIRISILFTSCRNVLLFWASTVTWNMTLMVSENSWKRKARQRVMLSVSSLRLLLMLKCGVPSTRLKASLVWRSLRVSV